MRRARIVAALGVVGVALAGCSQAPSAVPGVSKKPMQCAYTDHDLNAFTGLEQQLGELDCAVVFSDVTPSWQDWEHPWFLRDSASGGERAWREWATSDPDRRLVVTQSLIPSKSPDDWRKRGASGEYDQHARNLAQALVDAGLGKSIIRLAHEPNGTWFEHSVGDTPERRRDWARFWARTVRTMQSVNGAEFRFDLSINAGVRPIDPNEYWPGDDVVDIVGVDQYDSWPQKEQVTGADRWRVLRDQPGGLTELAAFAERHGKPLSIPETGLVESSQFGAGDDPEFVKGLRQWVQEHDVVYVAYFDKNVEGTLRLEQVPQSMAEWRAWVSGKTP